MKKVIRAMLLVLLVYPFALAAGEVSVKSVTAQQRYPWNGLVDIAVTMDGSADDVALAECFFTAINSATRAAVPVTSIAQNGSDSGSGTIWTRRYIWNAAVDVGAVKIDDLALTVDAKVLGVQLWENGPYWAECNVGATKPEEYGYYFWWGDTVGYKRNEDNNGWISVKGGTAFSFSSSNCQTYGKSDSELQSAGYIDATGNLVAAHDAATAHLGAPWRMPTDAEFAALISNCDTTWTTHGGVYGRLVTGRGAYASKSIFLPAAGYGGGSSLGFTGSDGYYWSSTPRSDYSYNAWSLSFYSLYFYRDYFSYRCRGQSVRPLRGFANGGTSTIVADSVTTHLKLDCRTGVRACSADGEVLRYDASWYENGTEARISENGKVIKTGAAGSHTWHSEPSCSGRHILNLEVFSGSQVVGTEAAEFESEALGHIEVVTTAAKEPTCTAAGCTKGSYCSRCNATLATSQTISALGHAEVVTTEAEAATCVAAGCTKGSYCTRCGAVLAVSHTLPAHDASASTGYWPEEADEICDGAFEGCEFLQCIDLSAHENIRRIGKRAFAGCWNLEEVILPPNVEEIDEEAFQDCSFLSRVTLPASVTTIGAGAFEDCSYLQEFVFTGELETLEARTFKGCTQLQKITLPDGLTTIKASAFEDCRRMQSVVLPLSLKQVGDRAFYGCNGLTGIALPTGVAAMKDWFSSVYANVVDVQIVPGCTNIVAGMFSGCVRLKTVDIPNGIVSIGSNAFKDCTALPNVRLPETLETLGGSVFYNCTSLESIVLPDAVTSIGTHTFYNCLLLHDITLSQSLGEIPDYTFHWCWNLDSFTVPASVKRLGKNIATCVYYRGLTQGPRHVYFLGSAPAYDADAYAGAMSDLKTYIKYNSRGWDGRASSRDIPDCWPVTGVSRAIAYWEAHQFDVSYQANGGAFTENGADAYDCLCTTAELYAVPPSNPARAGFKFAGWWTEPGGGTQITASTPVVLTKAHALYAHWEAAVTVNVRFNATNGTVKPAEKICVAGETFGRLPVPTREHFAFVGWYTQARGGYQVLPATEVPKADRELFAHWESATYVVRFHSNDGRDLAYDQYYRYGETFNLASCQFTNGKSQFNGWAKTAVGSVAYAENALFGDFGAIEASVVHLYAVWTGDAYVIRFDSNGGDGAMDNQTIDVGETRTLNPNVFTRKGWYFIGWSTTYNGDVVYKDGAAVKDLTAPKQEYALFAVWRRMPANSYQVIYTDGKTRNAEFCLTDKVYALPTNKFSPPAGKKFAGWACSNGRRYDDGVLVFNLAQPGETVTMTAIWE